MKAEAVSDASPDGHNQRSFIHRPGETAIELELLAPSDATDAHGKGTGTE